MKRAAEATKQLFPIHDMGKDELSELGYFPISVSIFDHWLKEEEDSRCEILFYEQAMEAGKLEEYMVGERCFLALYRDLAKEGAYIETEEGGLWSAKVDDPGFIRLQVESLREQNLMDVYFIGPQIRVQGGHDRTDLFLLRNLDYLPELNEKIRRHGLHTLVTKNFLASSASRKL